MPADIRATLPLPGLSPLAGKPIIARFDGRSLSSDEGLPALHEAEARLRHLAMVFGLTPKQRARSLRLADHAGSRG